MPDPTPAAEPKTQTPPWGSEENFDPARAWSLIVNLREEVDGLKAAKATVETERDEVRVALDKAQTEATEAVARADAAEAKTKESERSAWVASALAKHPLPDSLPDEDKADLLAFLTGETPEEIERKAARLAALRGEAPKADPALTGDEGQAPEVPGRPAPVLVHTPGHGGTTPEPFDAEAIAKAARASR